MSDLQNPAPDTESSTPSVCTPENLNYPEQLPVTGQRDTILKALREHQVVVVAGETGSGKTTQLPKMLLELGLAQQGLIGHTQPRRLAARSVAERLAEELKTQIGQTVGYQVRFTAEVGKDTSVKLMTDGILLAEIQRDPMLKKYSAIIIDEAHERSLNIDVILGYLKRILPKRPELKVVVTSATIDPQRFARHFSQQPLPAAEDELPEDIPIIEVSGRTYPVEIRYRPVQDLETLEDDDGEAGLPSGPASAGSEDRDLLDAVTDAVLELSGEPDGDILIFFPGEREIRDAADALTDTIKNHRKLANSEVLPLFGRLSLQEQRRVFTPGGRRRIVLATNVAETSLTVPGIKYVIDTGTARISRYSTRTKVQRLPIEPISQASANQRAGRCGRTSDGICIRLYSEEDFLSRDEFTDPEILRTSLASVLLQMSAMGITRTPDELLDFPFVQKPDSKAVNDAVRLLSELGALEGGGRNAGRVTATGRRLAQLPVDPRLGRMMVEAARRDCLTEVTVLVAGLSIQDVRERPTEKRDEADALHKRFADENSDFSALMNLWRYIQEQQKELSSSQFRKLCRREHLNWLRIREWQDLVSQLGELAQQAKLAEHRVKPLHGTDHVAKHDAVHKSLLAGLLSHIGLFTPRTRDYQGARGTRFAIFPGSGLFKKNHDLVMAAELVETSRLWARMAAKIDPAWAEELGAHLVKRTYSEPTWSAKKGAVVATERLTLFGVPIVADRQVLFGKIDPVGAREEFIRRALIEGDWSTKHHFDKRNRARFAELEELQERTRRRDLRAADQQLVDFFDQRLPRSITSQRAFDAWWKEQRHDTPELLDIPQDTLMAPAAEQVDLEAFPAAFDHDGLQLELTYAYEAGVTVRVPVLFLNQLQPHRFEWFIPGRRTEMITALIRQMPKQQRKNFVPAPDVAAQARQLLEEQYDVEVSPFTEALARVLRQLKGVVIDSEHLDTSRLPEDLRFTFAVVSERGRILDTGADLAELQVRFSAENREAIGRSLTGGGAGSVGTTGRSGQPGQSGQSGQPRQSRQSGGVESHQQSSAGSQQDRQDAVTGAGERVDTSARQQVTWTFGDIPSTVATRVAGREVTGYPALTPDGPGVRLMVAQSAAEQQRTHRAGVVALLSAVLPSPQRYVVEHLSNRERLAFGQFAKDASSSTEQMVAEATTAALDHLVPAELPYTAAAFEQISRNARAELIETVLSLTDVMARVLTLNTEARARLSSVRSAALKPAVSDMQAQIDQLVHPGFITATGFTQMHHLPRYLQAMLLRLDRLEAGQGLAKDTTDMQAVQELEDEYDAAIEAVPPQLPVPPELAQVKWMLEELRVNLFAQSLGTPQTVSAKRVRRAIKQAGQV
ncbi:ATP-dependent RNA helicase HrpA [Nesterenkonia massiliensis]|uniref:RNA helicase n=1 Tax=Nesterenkonia massiliensis TaxID=1232429 RepID=A0ABT2HQI5_9MICC|nr:ATP-dependent RNA helicase HrpA [Nesterenkonia massiliensis]MCT1606951.1 ATP-dependent RNA helicase HrpA [Nesterenkonia massiliensis]